MKALWRHLAAKIDTRSRRDRMIALALFMLMGGVMGYFMLLAPTFAAQDKVRREIVARENDVAQSLTQIQSLQKGRIDPDAANRERIEQLGKLLTETQSGLQQKRDRVVPAEKVSALLEEVLNRHGKLVLVDLRTVGAKPLFDPKDANESTKGNDASGREMVRGIYRHAIEIRVRGSYLDLLAYLNELERLSIQVFWSDIAVEVKDYPVTEMKVTLFTVSFDKAWMTV